MTPSNPSTAVPSEADLVSIVIPCYNSERYLEQTLDSVRSQTYANWEIVAVDDASTDSTPAMLAAAAAADPRIRVLRRERSGGRPAVSKNHGIPACRGAYIAFLDHDDLIHPSKLERQVAALKSQPEAVAAFSNARYIDGDGKPQGQYLESLLVDAGPHLQPCGQGVWKSTPDFWIFQVTRYAAMLTATVLIRKTLLPEGFVRYDERFSICDDTELWVRLGKEGCILYLDEDLAQYRLHDSNATRNELKVHQDIAALMRLHDGRYSAALPAQAATQLKARRADVQASLAWQCRRSGQPAAAFSASWERLWLQPSPRAALDLLKAWLPAKT